MPQTPDPERRAPADSEALRRAGLFAGFSTKESPRNGAVLAERYQVRGFLTSGASARVYLAEDLTTHLPVVVKMLAPETANKEEFRRRLLREADVTRAIDHPNVVNVLGTGETDEGVPFLVMEALLGESFGEYLRRQALIPFDTAVILLKQAAVGLAAAHRAGVVHRDVKPDNFLLLGPPGEPYGLKVIDFGLAKLWNVGGSTGTHNILGTAEYMAPEQILVEAIDPRSDIYSLGVVMFRVFTGHLPFESVGAADLLRHQLFSSVPPPSWLNEDLDPRVDQLVQVATRKHRENRYGTMNEVIAELDVLLGIETREFRDRPLSQAPDEYLPTTDRGREAAKLLAEKFGAYASRSSSRPSS